MEKPKFRVETTNKMLYYQESDSDILPFAVETTSDNLPPYVANISPIDDMQLPEHYTIKTIMDAKQNFSLYFNTDTKYKIKHETVAAYCELNETDTCFREDLRFSVGVDDADIGRMSPDARYEINNTIYWLEIGTVNSHSADSLRNAAERKLHKYQDAIGKLNWHEDRVSVLIVGLSGVVSNFELDLGDVNGLVAFYRLGTLIETKFKRIKGIETMKQEDDYVRGQELLAGVVIHDHKAALNNVNNQCDDESLRDLLITEEISNYWSDLKIDNTFLIDQLKKAHKSYVRKNSKRKKSNDYLKQFLDESRTSADGSVRETRTDRKAIIQLPMIDPIGISETGLMFPLGEDVESRTVYKFISEWLKLDHNRMSNEEKLLMANLSESDIASWVTNNKKTGKIKIDFEDDIITRFVNSGVRSKKCHSFEYTEKKRREKLVYDWETCVTEDIDNYLDTIKSWHVPTPIEMDQLGSTVDPLIRSANQIALGKDICETDEAIRAYSTTKIGRTLNLLDWLMQEVNIGLAKQCGKNEYYIKKHPKLDIWIVTLSTGISKNVHFKMMCRLIPGTEPEELIMPLSKRPITITDSNGDKILSWDFLSVNRHKATHYLSCFEKMCANVMMWLDLAGVLWKDYANDVKKGDFEGWHHGAMYISLLTYLHDKQGVVDMLQNIRYAYMECMNGSALPLHPYKIFRKFGQCRSRLQSWIFKRLIVNLDKMWANKPKPTLLSDDDPTRNKDSWTNLISWIDGTDINRMEQALCLMYLGVLHNKNEGDEFQANFQIFQKIIKEEITLIENSRKRFMGSEEPELSDIRSHEFSPKMVALAGKLTSNFLRRKFGTIETWYDNLEERLANQMSEDPLKLATMKASALEPSEYKAVVASGDNPKNKRALEAIAKEIDNDGLNWTGSLSNLNESIDQLEREGMHVSLFKKNQLTGVREIFILSMNSRRCIYFLETISRLICDDLPMEMLTKGKQKIDRAKSHFYKVKKQVVDEEEVNKELFHCATSGDCTTWCQQFIMRTFACLLRQILPDKLYWPVARILNCVTKKKLRLPQSMLNKFVSLSFQVNSVDPGMNLLKEEFLSGTERQTPVLIKKGERLMYNRSNMMQGILHFTSSLLHCGTTLVQEDMMRMLLQGIPLSCTTQLSSDDFGWLITARTKDQMETARVCWAHHLTLGLYPLFNIRISEEKSTICGLNGLYEFNSFFLSLNSYCIPIIKYVYSSLVPKVKSRFDDRFHNYSNLLKQVLESGGSLSLTMIIQKLQARIHYATLGALTDDLFPIFRDKLLSNKHPVFGYFAFEPVPGLLGHNYAKYKLLCHSEEQMNLEASVLSAFKADILDTGVSFSLRFLLGKEKNYANFKKRLGKYLDVEAFREHYDMDNIDNHHELYTRPSDKDQLKFKLAMRATSPGISESMSFDSANKMYASSVYILWMPVCSVNTTSSEELNETAIKVSLLRSFDLIQKSPLTDTSWLKALYPMRSYYEEMDTHLRQYNWKKVVNLERNRRIIKFSLVRDNFSVPISLENVVRSIWFGMSTRYTKFEIKNAWSKYKSIYPWLDDSYRVTCEMSPFKDGVSLKNFVSTIAPGKVNLEIISTFKSQSYGHVFPRIICKTWNRGYKLVSHQNNPEIIEERSERYRELVANLNEAALLITGPPRMNVEQGLRDIARKTFLTVKLEKGQLKKGNKRIYQPVKFVESESILISEIRKDTDLLSRRNLRMWMFLRCMSLSSSAMAHELINMIKTLRMGFIGAYIKRQDLTGGVYTGIGEYEAHVDGDIFRFIVKGGDIIKMIIQNELSLKRLGKAGLNKILNAMSRNLNVKKAYGTNTWNLETWTRSNSYTGGLAFELRKSLKGAIDPNKLNLRAEISSGRCRVLNCEGDKEFVVFSFYPQADLEKTEKLETSNPGEAWFGNRPLRSDIAQTLINRSMDNTSMRRWIEDTLSDRLRFKGIKTSAMRFSYEKIEEEDKELLMSDMMDAYFQESLSITRDDLIEIGNEFVDTLKKEAPIEGDFAFDDIGGELGRMDNFISGMIEEIEIIDTHKRISIYSQHRFWDSYIKALIDNRGYYELMTDINSQTKVTTENLGYNNFLNCVGNEDKPVMRQIETSPEKIDLSFTWGSHEDSNWRRL